MFEDVFQWTLKRIFFLLLFNIIEILSGLSLPELRFFLDLSRIQKYFFQYFKMVNYYLRSIWLRKQEAISNR